MPISEPISSHVGAARVCKDQYSGSWGPVSWLLLSEDGKVQDFFPCDDQLLGLQREDIGQLIQSVAPRVRDKGLVRALKQKGSEEPSREICRIEGIERVVSRWIYPSTKWDGDAGGALAIYLHEPSHDGGGEAENSAHDVPRSHDGKHRLAELSRLESLGLLAGGVVHDFNNLLTGILLSTRHAQEEELDSKQLHQSLAVIQKAAEQAVRICDQMLSFSGNRVLHVTRTKLSDVVQEGLGLVNHAIPENIRLVCHSDNSSNSIEVDVTQILQVVSNLVINAVEAIGSGSGEVRLATGLETIDRNYLEQHDSCSHLDEGGVYVFLRVEDTGCGMNSTTVKRIFDPFFTTKPEGNGLGLAAVHGIVRAHHGAVDVKSREGEGTGFTILLPLAEFGLSPMFLDGKEAGDDRKPIGGRALIIEDEALVLEPMKILLTKIGIGAISIATDGREGYNLFKEKPDDFDVVFVDFTMPNWGAPQTFPLFREIRPNIPVVVVSGDPENRVRAAFKANEQSFVFLKKPFDFEAIREVVSGALKVKEQERKG